MLHYMWGSQILFLGEQEVSRDSWKEEEGTTMRPSRVGHWGKAGSRWYVFLQQTEVWESEV